MITGFYFVGIPGFEPGTPWSQTRCANRTALHPDEVSRREGDSNPRYGYPYGSLANCWFQPLTHLSVADFIFFNFVSKIASEPKLNIISSFIGFVISLAERGCKYRTTFYFRKILSKKNCVFLWFFTNFSNGTSNDTDCQMKQGNR